jgi:hypothetical protein
MCIVTLWTPIYAFIEFTGQLCVFSMLEVFKWLLYIKYIVKKCKQIFYGLCLFLYAQTVLNTSTLRIFPVKQFRVFLYLLKFNDLTYCILEQLVLSFYSQWIRSKYQPVCIPIYIQQDATLTVYIWKMLCMFRVVPPPETCTTVSRYKPCNVASCCMYIRILLRCTDPWTLNINQYTLMLFSRIHTCSDDYLIYRDSTKLPQFKAIHMRYRFCRIHRHLVLIKPRHTWFSGVEVYISATKFTQKVLYWICTYFVRLRNNE